MRSTASCSSTRRGRPRTRACRAVSTTRMSSRRSWSRRSSALGLAALMRGVAVLRLLVFGAVVFCAAGVSLTGSRGGLMSLAVAMIAFLLTGSRFRGRLLLVTIALVFAAFGYYNYIASPEARERLLMSIGKRADGPLGNRVADGRGLSDPWRGRRELRDRVVQYLLQPGAIERPEFFIGRRRRSSTTCISRSGPSWRGGPPPVLVHSRVWDDRGRPGDAGVCTSGRRSDGGLASRGLVAFAAVLAADFFGSRQYDKELWIMLGLSRRSGRSRRPPTESRHERPPDDLLPRVSQPGRHRSR